MNGSTRYVATKTLGTSGTGQSTRTRPKKPESVMQAALRSLPFGTEPTLTLPLEKVIPTDAKTKPWRQ